MNRPLLKCAVWAAVLMLPVLSLAQPDTIRRQQSVDITSAYKPTARNAAKINFSASPLTADAEKNLRTYEVPAQNLFFAYKPISLKPLSLDTETGPVLGDRNFVKAGIGNYTTPYARAVMGLGDGETSLLNFYGEYISSKAKLEFQQYSRLRLGASASYFWKGNEIYATAGIRRDNYFLYGYDHDLYKYERKDVLQSFREFDLTAGGRNSEENEWGLYYHPTVQINLFSMGNKASETTFVTDLPVEKSFNDNISARVNVRADLTKHSSGDDALAVVSFKNNIVTVAPSVSYTGKTLNLHLGLSPAWNNGAFNLLPDVKAEATFNDKFMLHAGWTGRIIKNSYRNLTRINPYLEPLPGFVSNTVETEYYGGLKAGLGKHFSFSAQVGWVTITDMALFINDTSAAGKGFRLVNEASANNLRIMGSMSYVKAEKFSAGGSVVLNGYTGFSEKAWHTLPVEINGKLRWVMNKKLTLRSDLFMFTGGNYLKADGKAYDLKGGIDLSAGAEYVIKSNLSAWLDVNNVLNDKYERWNAYPVFGINLLGGLIVKF